MKAVPLTRDQCNELLLMHRHHGGVVSYRYGVGVEHEGKLVGCAVIGRPVARQVEQYRVAEVTRVVTDGTPNACSFLYGLSSRLCRMLGFDRVFTAILESEPGTSLKAAGWRYEYTTRGGSWNRAGRARTDKAPLARNRSGRPMVLEAVTPQSTCV